MTTGLLHRWLADGALELPLPASGDTMARWRALADLTEIDVVAGRLAEAHADAVAIIAEIGSHAVEPGQLWGVWAAEAPEAVLRARRTGDTIVVDGTKAWCSGAGMCSHALITARADDDPDGARGLFAVTLDHPGVHRRADSWRNAGMAGSDTRTVDFVEVPAIPVGAAGRYLERPGFWHGAIGVAACWWGAARAVAAPLYAAGIEAQSPHLLAHLGAVDAALCAAQASLEHAAREIDADPRNDSGAAQLVARRTRAVVEATVEDVIRRTGRALGPGPLAMDTRHAANVADLEMYVRQSHAERDLEALGRLAASAR